MMNLDEKIRYAKEEGTELYKVNSWPIGFNTDGYMVIEEGN